MADQDGTNSVDLPVADSLAMLARFFRLLRHPVEPKTRSLLRRKWQQLRGCVRSRERRFAGVRLGIRDLTATPVQSMSPASPHVGSIWRNAGRARSGPMRYPDESIRIEPTTLAASRSSSGDTTSPPHHDLPRETAEATILLGRRSNLPRGGVQDRIDRHPIHAAAPPTAADPLVFAGSYRQQPFQKESRSARKWVQ